MFFIVIIIVLLVIIIILSIVFKNYPIEKLKHETNLEFQKLQKCYVIVYCLVCFADWLQGPYIYSLYKQYGFTEREIAILFITGTISNSIFGTIAGILADIYGRKMLCISYGILYTGCCLTKVFGNFQLLLIGRVLGGISTSILYSTFDSWYINEHINYFNFPNEWMNNTFSKATFMNSMLAIFAGILSYILVNVLDYGPIAPFLIAIPILITSSIYTMIMLNEHFIHNSKSASTSMKKSIILWLTNKDIFTLSIIQSLYEGVLYLFIFSWAPILEPLKAPLGLVFSSFMLALIIGSKLYSILLGNNLLDTKKLLELSTFLGTFSFLLCNLVFLFNLPYTILTCYFFFILYEISIGIYMPSMTYLKSLIIPENVRVTLSNVVKIPTNFFISFVLLRIKITEENQKINVNIISTIFISCLISTALTFVLSKFFTKFNRITYKDNKNQIYI